MLGTSSIEPLFHGAKQVWWRMESCSVACVSQDQYWHSYLNVITKVEYLVCEVSWLNLGSIKGIACQKVQNCQLKLPCSNASMIEARKVGFSTSCTFASQYESSSGTSPGNTHGETSWALPSTSHTLLASVLFSHILAVLVHVYLAELAYVPLRVQLGCFATWLFTSNLHIHWGAA